MKGPVNVGAEVVRVKSLYPERLRSKVLGRQVMVAVTGNTE